MEITFKNIFDWIMRGIVFILVITFLFGAVMFTYTKYFVAPTYTANVKFYASPTEENKTQLLAEYYRSVAPQYIEFLNVTEFYEMVAKELQEETGISLTPKAISATIRFSSIIADTSSFFVVIETTDASLSYHIAMAVAKLAPEQINRFENVGVLEVLSNPQMPTGPSGPNLSKNVILGMLVGAVLSAALVVVRELLDNRIKTPEEIAELFEIPLFGVVPDFQSSAKKGGK